MMGKGRPLFVRLPAGIEGFDELVEGGFPLDGLILLAGHPGAGKTTFASQFIFTGATVYRQKGVYVTFAETKAVLLRNALRFKWDFEELERQEKVKILDMTAARDEEFKTNVEQILKVVADMGAERLVLDSFTAMATAVRDPIDLRIFLHLLYKFLQKVHCTTVMVVDMPWGTCQINTAAQFISDGIILMEIYYDSEGMQRRRMRILKMRGTNHSPNTWQYEITDRGVKIHVPEKIGVK